MLLFSFYCQITGAVHDKLIKIMHIKNILPLTMMKRQQDSICTLLHSDHQGDEGYLPLDLKYPSI